MTSAAGPKAPIVEIAGHILQAMRSMGVSPIPRNYQLFYEAMVGSNAELSRDFTKLAPRARQEDLDQLAALHLGNQGATAVERAQTRIQAELEGVLALLRQEKASLESYNKLLFQTQESVNAKNALSAELLASAINLLATATGETLASGERTVEGMVQRSREMEAVRKELDTYKRIANTDSLTRLANRRAFDERLSSLYDDAMPLPVTALILADIDHFKKINDTFGHPVGDKILASVAGIIRAGLPRDIFVARSGGEEFAIIATHKTMDEVMEMCERIRTALNGRAFRNSRTGVDYGPVTLSLGFAMGSQAADPGELYARADTALYCAKNGGRNRTMLFEDGMAKDYAGKSWLIYRG
ncbi:diguanylate cyclase [Neorhizobium galegae]|uniref:GGDEF domain-containing protein n=1 Tax=Neorhizobium galegae TaxID=399 RepID=UPI001AE4D3CA|nr:GGDEF domain-containing protein [Neorhizobium galegae]MBP2549340.1 diguanylate cyclase [Neorhizobium galegae]